MYPWSSLPEWGSLAFCYSFGAWKSSPEMALSLEFCFTNSGLVSKQGISGLLLLLGISYLAEIYPDPD